MNTRRRVMWKLIHLDQSWISGPKYPVPLVPTRLAEDDSPIIKPSGSDDTDR